jgi:hypothetical protein
MGSWYQPGTHGVPRQGRRGDPQVVLDHLACPDRPANPRPEPTTSDPQVLRFFQAGHCYPPRLDRTNRDSPWECPGSKQGPSSAPGSKEEPPWIPRQGRRDDPQAVLGRLACGERLANPTSASVSIHPLNRSST